MTRWGRGSTSWRRPCAPMTSHPPSTSWPGRAGAAEGAPPAVHLVARPGRIDRDELVEASGGIPALYSPYGVYLEGDEPGAIRAVTDGRAAVQDEGSQLVAAALANAPLTGPDRSWLDL